MERMCCTVWKLGGLLTAVALIRGESLALPESHRGSVADRFEDGGRGVQRAGGLGGPGLAPAKDYNHETPIVIWAEQSSVPVSAEALVACLWIGLVASTPFLNLMLEGKKITRVQIAMFCTMWVAFWGGILLFTNVIYFQSSHFTSTRSLTIVESVYLLSQILTTVGYGDITPATPQGQIFVGLYVVFSMLVIANIVAEVADMVAEHAKSIAAKLAMSGTNPTAENADVITRAMQFWKLVRKDARPLELFAFWRSAASFIFFATIGILFYHYYPGERKTWGEAFYMSIITLSTVGFGAVTPSTEAGKVFGAFWMLFGSASLVALIGSFLDVTSQIKERERHDPHVFRSDVTQALQNLPQHVNLADFMIFSLVRSKLVDKGDLDAIVLSFENLEKDDTGLVPRDTVETALFPHIGLTPKHSVASNP